VKHVLTDEFLLHGELLLHELKGLQLTGIHARHILQLLHLQHTVELLQRIQRRWQHCNGTADGIRVEVPRADANSFQVLTNARRVEHGRRADVFDINTAPSFTLNILGSMKLRLGILIGLFPQSENQTQSLVVIFSGIDKSANKGIQAERDFHPKRFLLALLLNHVTVPAIGNARFKDFSLNAINLGRKGA
jgi:hypothetical protein